MHLALASLPAELQPPSRPTSPASAIRTERLREAIIDGMHKGLYLGDLVRLDFARRSHAPMPPPEQQDLPPGFEYIIAETEEEWFEWEKRVEAARAQAKAHNKASATSTTRSRPPKRREDIENWQADVRAGGSSQARQRIGLPADTTFQAEPHLLEGGSQGATLPAKLGFPVVKRASLTSKGKKGSEGPTGPPGSSKSLNHHRSDKLPSSVQSSTQAVDSVLSTSQPKGVTRRSPSPKRIADLSDSVSGPPA
jgi:neural Wiskott-Aldrich syndrome protein